MSFWTVSRAQSGHSATVLYRISSTSSSNVGRTAPAISESRLVRRSTAPPSASLAALVLPSMAETREPSTASTMPQWSVAAPPGKS